MGVQEAADEAPPELTGALARPLLATKLAIPPPASILVQSRESPPLDEVLIVLLNGLAATAGYRVGYESPSQFICEYRRLFGAPQQTDVGSLRGTALLGF